MEKFLTALLITFGVVILHTVTHAETAATPSLKLVLAEISFQPHARSLGD